MPVKMKSGKSYLTVIERMNLLIEEKGKEDYSLETSVQYDSGIVIVKATLTLFYCYPKDETSTVEVVSRKYCGHALGELGKAKTLEATETHAIGRALASAGWFGDEFASANEMESWEQSKPTKRSGGMSQVAAELDEKYDGSEGVDIEKEMTSEDVATNLGGEVIKEKRPINFGKHKGKEWSELPIDYVEWVASKSNVDWQRDEGKAELARRKPEKVEEEIPF